MIKGRKSPLKRNRIVRKTISHIKRENTQRVWIRNDIALILIFFVAKRHWIIKTNQYVLNIS